MERLRRFLAGRSVLQAGLVVFLLVAGVMAARFVAHGADPTFFVDASRPPAERGTVPAGFVVQAPGGGYDGMFFYSLAVRPLQHGDRGLIPLDNPPYRQQRIGYPMAAYVLALGSRAWVPWTLLLTNLAALAGIVLLLSQRAAELGRPPVVGAAIALAPGITFAMARDLSEPLALALVLAAFAAARTDRWVAAGLMMSAAVLTRETAVLAVGAIVVGTWVDDRREPLRSRVPAAIAGLGAVTVAAIWQFFLSQRWGVLPVRAAGPDAIGTTPFAGIVDGVRTDLQRRTGVDALGLILLSLVLAVMVFALAALPRSRASTAEKLLVVATVLLAAFLKIDVWVSFAGFPRALNDALVFGGIVLLGVPTRLRSALWLSPIAWLPIAAYVVARP